MSPASLKTSAVGVAEGTIFTIAFPFALMKPSDTPIQIVPSGAVVIDRGFADPSVGSMELSVNWETCSVPGSKRPNVCFSSLVNQIVPSLAIAMSRSPLPV